MMILAAPFQSFDGLSLYKTIPEKASRLCLSLINNHPFIDGNKRTGILVLEYFLEINNLIIKCPDDELIQLGMDIACGEIDHQTLTEWLNNHL